MDDPGGIVTTSQDFTPDVDNYEVRIGVADPENPGTITTNENDNAALDLRTNPIYGLNGTVYITEGSSVVSTGTGNSSAIDIYQVGDLEIYNDGLLSSDSSAGIGLYEFGDLTIVNTGTIHGGQFGVWGAFGDDVDIENASADSMVGETFGVYMSDIGTFDYDNAGGVTAGTAIDGDGIHLSDVRGDAELIDLGAFSGGFSTIIDNYAYYNDDLGFLQSGLIAGGGDGIYGEDFWNGNILIDNGGYWVAEGDAQEDENIVDGYAFRDGGLIVGEDGDGIDLNGFDDDVYIDNSNTNISQFLGGAVVEDPDVAALLSGLSVGFTAGIWGEDAGITLNGEDDSGESGEDAGYVGINNFNGRVVGVNGDGIRVQVLDGDEDGDAFGLINGNGGLVWGGDDGVYAYDLDGDVYIDNAGINGEYGSEAGPEDIGPVAYFGDDGFRGGTIFGMNDGLDINNIWRGDVGVMNSEGHIYGLYGDAIHIDGVLRSGEDGGQAIILNSDGFTPFGGGEIIGGDNAVEIVEAESGVILNGFDGLIIGDGYWTTEDAVINLNLSSSYIGEGYLEGGDGASGLIANFGIMGSHNLPVFDYDWSVSGPTDIPDHSFDLSALYDDAEGFWGYVWDGGSIDQLDGSLDGYDLTSYGNAANDMLIRSSGGGLLAYNAGFMSGRINADGNNLGEEDGFVGNEVINEGIWFVQDNYSWGTDLQGSESAFDFIQNTGWVQTAFGGEDSASFYVDAFINGYDYADSDFGSPLFGEDGRSVLSMADGDTEDSVYISGEFIAPDMYGEEYASGARSYVAMDVYLEGGEGNADFLDIGEDVYGTTGMIFRQINDGPVDGPVLGDIIPVAHVGGSVYDAGDCTGTYCKEGDAFFIDSRSDGYAMMGDIPIMENGLFGWALSQEETSSEEFYLEGVAGPGALNAPRVITGAQDIFYDTLNVVEDQNYGNQFAGSGGGGADLSTDYAAPYAAPATSGGGTRTGLWAKATGSWTDRDTTVNEDGFGDIDTSSSQDTYSFLGGADMKPGGVDSPIRIGLFGGYVTSSLNFDLGSDSSVDYEGGVVGAYVAYNDGAFYIDGTVKGDILSADYHFSGLDVDADVNSVGVAANTGYRMTMGSAFFEPIASLTYVHSTVDDVSTAGGSVDFSNGTSLRAGAGARLGTVMATGGNSTEVSVLGKVWNEFEGDNTVSVSDGFTTDTFTDDVSGVFGEASARVTVTSVDGSLSGFLSGGGKFSEDFTSLNAQAGIRKGF